MTITVEDGSIVTDADSYVTVEFADAYFAFDSGFGATWAAMLTAAKENRLKWATRVIDQTCTFKGTKTDEDSTLRWPRSGVYDRDRNLISDSVIPIQLKQLVCEVAKWLENADPTTSDQQLDMTKSIEVDVIKIEYQDTSGVSTVPPIFNRLLNGIGTYPTAGTHTFGKIVKV